MNSDKKIAQIRSISESQMRLDYFSSDDIKNLADNSIKIIDELQAKLDFKKFKEEEILELRNYAEKLQAENEKLKDQMAWKDIASAPKDGTEIYLLCSTERKEWSDYYVQGKFIEGRWYYYTLDNSGGYGEMDWVTVEEYRNITHWRHLIEIPNKPN